MRSGLAGYAAAKEIIVGKESRIGVRPALGDAVANEYSLWLHSDQLVFLCISGSVRPILSGSDEREQNTCSNDGDDSFHNDNDYDFMQMYIILPEID